MEHLEHFGLAMDPFSNEPDLSFFYESVVHLDAQRRLERSAKQGKGLTILSGAHGSGKSLLTRRLFEELDEELYEAVLMVVLPGASDATTILRRLARELGAQEIGELHQNGGADVDLDADRRERAPRRTRRRARL